jgi:Zn-dependent metalloprotease
MNKFTLLLASSFLSISSFAQLLSKDEHNHNPDITPFHDAIESTNGYSYSTLRKQTAWQTFAKQHPTWGVTFDSRTKLPHRAIGNPIAFAEGGHDAIAKAKAFLNQSFVDFKLPIEEMVVTRNSNDGKYVHVDFKQVHDGLEVINSRIMVRFTQKLEVIMFGIDAHRNLPMLHAVITPNMAQQTAEKAISTTIQSSNVASKLVWYPYPIGHAYEYKQAYVVTVNTQDNNTTPGKYKTYVDAVNGEILARQNEVKHIGFNVTASAYPTNLYSPLATLPLKNLMVKQVGNSTTYYTDLTGLVTLPGTNPMDAMLTLSGKFVKVVTGQAGTTSATYTENGVIDGDVVDFPFSGTSNTERHTTCYYHANEIHDFMKSKLPSFTSMDNTLTARVDRTDNTCNAFYDGSSINFYATAGGCNALSLVSDVMYHEYGHGISNVFWNANGSSFDNGGQGEGYSDVWAMSILKTPLIGAGIYVGQPNSTIRRYDLAPKVYPQDITGEVHADGEIIAGAWWDVAVNIGAGSNLSNGVDTMSTLFADSHYGLATGPDGTEGKVYHDILLDALQYDDNNNNLNDGTPHFSQILQAFARHGIYLLSQTEMEHSGNNVLQSVAPLLIQTLVSADYPVFLGDVKMFYKNQGSAPTDSVTLVKINDSIYNTTFIAPATASNIIEYYFMLYDNSVLSYPSVNEPANSKFSVAYTQRNIPYYILYGYTSVQLQNFDNLTNTSTDWQVGGVVGDSVTLNTRGRWQIAVPIQSKTTEGDIVQTGDDHTPGNGKCAVTGNATSTNSSATAADVDQGKTTLITNKLDLSFYNSPIISYWRWYTNSQGSNPRKDLWRVWISYNDGATWTTIERTFQPDVRWRKFVVVPNNTDLSQVRLKFEVYDNPTSATSNSGALVEAAIDDIEILEGEFTTSIEKVSTLQSLVYPNPANNQINVSTNEIGTMNYKLLNAVGSIIQSGQLQMKGFGNINTSLLADGFYVLQMEMNGKTSTKKVSILR